MAIFIPTAWLFAYLPFRLIRPLKSGLKKVALGTLLLPVSQSHPPLTRQLAKSVLGGGSPVISGFGEITGMTYSVAGVISASFFGRLPSPERPAPAPMIQGGLFVGLTFIFLFVLALTANRCHVFFTVDSRTSRLGGKMTRRGGPS